MKRLAFLTLLIATPANADCRDVRICDDNGNCSSELRCNTTEEWTDRQYNRQRGYDDDDPRGRTANRQREYQRRYSIPPREDGPDD